jgi:hypothetical protein
MRTNGEVRNMGDLRERGYDRTRRKGVARAGVGGAHSTWEAGNDRGGKGPWFRVLFEEWTSGGIGASLTTPTKLEEFQEKLYVKAKAEVR